MKKHHIIIILIFLLSLMSCNITNKSININASQILGNPDYQAISYGGFRHNTRDIVPTKTQVTEDMKILSAMGIKIIRTYNVHIEEIKVILEVIKEMKSQDPNFEMYVMLGAWIDCKNAWTDKAPIHDEESLRNEKEIEEAVRLTNQYPDIIKIIAVGNEAMVKWATNYYVHPKIILKWVNHLQDLKKQNKLPKDLWITSSDNFASWGGGSEEYHVEDLNQLIKAVDYISVHTYPMHDTHYNPVFWGLAPEEVELSKQEQVENIMLRSLEYAKNQVENVKKYMNGLGVDKPIHIGETGWATQSKEFYGNNGAKAIDEYKSARFYHLMRDWTNQNNISCFYFEAFDENWKDANNPQGSENHFGLINLKSEAKYVLWEMVDQGIFKGLKRDGKPISKTYNGDVKKLLDEVQIPEVKKELQLQTN